jgi:single-strand DNA-binding protein
MIHSEGHAERDSEGGTVIQVNRVIIAGNLTHDPELRHTPSGYPVCAFSIAINRKSRLPDGQAREDVSFVEIKTGGRTAEDVATYLLKGRLVLVEGRLKQERWNARDGSGPRSKVVVHALSVQFLNAPPPKTADQAAPAPAAHIAEPPPAEEYNGEAEEPF